MNAPGWSFESEIHSRRSLSAIQFNQKQINPTQMHMNTNNVTVSDLGSDEPINNYRFLHLEITQFSPINWTRPPEQRGESICATLTLDGPPGGSDPDITVALTGQSGNSGNSLKVRFPSAGTHRDFNFGFCLNGSDYILSGIRFLPGTGCLPSTLGPILTNRNEGWTTLTVTDHLYQNTAVVEFQYVLLVKKKATGEIGILGPIAVKNDIY